MKKIFRTITRTVALALMLCAPAGVIPAMAQSDGGNTSLIVELKSGEKQKFMLADEPVVTFTATDCKLVTADYEISCPMADIEKAYFDKSNAVETLGGETVKIDLSNPGAVTVSGVEPETGVAIYDLNGLRLAEVAANANGTATLNIEGLPSHTVYVVNISNLKNFKIYKR